MCILSYIFKNWKNKREQNACATNLDYLKLKEGPQYSLKVEGGRNEKGSDADVLAFKKASEWKRSGGLLCYSTSER